jgi:hypothetical protein
MSRSVFVTLDNPDGRTTKGYFGASFNAAAQGGVCLNLVNGGKRYLPFSAEEFEMLVRAGEDNPTGLRFVDFKSSARYIPPLSFFQLNCDCRLRRCRRSHCRRCAADCAASR